MAPFAVCSNLLCNFLADLDVETTKVQCPKCRSPIVTACRTCHTEITEEGVSGKFTSCNFCGADVREGPPPAPAIVGAEIDDLEQRLERALKCLAELVVLVMEQIAVVSRIDVEDLVEACGMANAAGGEDDRQAPEPPPNLKPCTNVASYNGSEAVPQKTQNSKHLSR